MLRPYREVLALPGALAFSSAGFVARMPIAMMGIGIVLLVAAQQGSYGIAGGVSATFGVLQGVTAPLIARVVDRHGQARVMRPAIATHATAVGALAVCAAVGAPLWTLFASAAVAGASMGSIGALVRARWNAMLDGPRLHTAFSLESVLDEASFVLGPVLVTLLATRVAPAAGLLAALTAAVVGGFTFTALRRTEPAVTGRAHVAGSGVLRRPGMVVLVVTFVLVGAIFGSADVNAVAFTAEQGHPAAAGAVVACMAGGSMLSGIGYGTVHWRSPPGQRFLLGVLVLALGVVPFTFATSIPVLAAVMFVAGFAVSPMIISGNALVQQLVPPGRLTEGLTWVATALGIGASVGAAGSGQAVDQFGASRAFLVTVASGLVGAVCALGGARWLRADASASSRAPPEDEPIGSAAADR